LCSLIVYNVDRLYVLVGTKSEKCIYYVTMTLLSKLRVRVVNGWYLHFLTDICLTLTKFAEFVESV